VVHTKSPSIFEGVPVGRGSLYIVEFIFFITIFFTSCNYTKNLPKNEYALVKNTVKVEEVKGAQFDDLIDLVRPIPVKKFMGIFPIKVSLWAYHQPKMDSVTGIIKDSKFNRWLRKNGEEQALLDSSDMQRSMKQIELAMFKRGYFDAKTRAEVHFLKKQKVRVNYFVTPNQPYYIRKVIYQIEIPEYKRIVITDTANALVKKGKMYKEDDLVAERNRIVNKIRDNGFFYATPDVVTFWIDTIQVFSNLSVKQNPTVEITVKISFDDVIDVSSIAKKRNRYKFNDVLIFTNYDLKFEKNVNLDTIPYYDFRNKSDSTLYEFVTIKKLKKKSNKLKLIKDYNSRTIVNAIWMKKSDLYTQTAYDRTRKKFSDLNNFTLINITYEENVALWDSINKMGVLNTTVRLTRAKQHDANYDFDIRTDRTGLSLAYNNRNIFKGAEYFRIGGFGNVYYYNWLTSQIKNIQLDNQIYGEFGGYISFTFPLLLMLPKDQNINYISYYTEIKFSASYTQLFSRLNLQLAYTYRWSPVRGLTHSISPVDVATLDSRSSRGDTAAIASYPISYQRKFDKFFLPTFRYILNYSPPLHNKKYFFNLNFSFENAGLMLYTINLAVDKKNIWTVFKDYNYGIYEKFDLNLSFTKFINKNNSFASRFIFGMAIPLRKGTVIPFERSFFVGGANSMRGWTFRQLGPGGYYSDPEKYIERVGDMRLELNLEYRGTIFRAFKYGVFSDIGNIWLLSKYEDMPNAEFTFSNFYKQIAVCFGVGLRLDFDYFLIRLDYGLPIYDPSKPLDNYWINKNWRANNWWTWAQGIQFAINYAF
jgi:hypothetical protein